MLRNVFRNVMVIILCKVFVCYVRTPSLGEEHISVVAGVCVGSLGEWQGYLLLKVLTSGGGVCALCASCTKTSLPAKIVYINRGMDVIYI